MRLAGNVCKQSRKTVNHVKVYIGSITFNIYHYRAKKNDYTKINEAL